MCRNKKNQFLSGLVFNKKKRYFGHYGRKMEDFNIKWRAGQTGGRWYGILIVAGVAVTWVGSTQFSQSTQKNYNGGCGWGAVPGYSPVALARWVVFFYLTWLVANYSYLRALRGVSASLVTALFSTAPAFVAVGSVVAVFGDPSPDTVGVLLAWYGICAATLGSALLGVLLGGGWESVQWGNVPWGTLAAAHSLSLAFNFLVNFGIALTYPLFISLGTVVGIPLNRERGLLNADGDTKDDGDGKDEAAAGDSGGGVDGVDGA
eukprot:gene17325-54169_t